MWLPVGRLRQRQSWDGGLDPVGEQGALGPLPQGLSPLQPHARLGPRPSSGQQARSPAPTQVPAAGCPAGGSCQGWPPPWAPPDVFQGPRDPSAPRGAFPRWPPAELVPSPRSGGSLSRFFPGYSGPQASGPAPGASRPPGQGPGPILSGLAGPHPRTCLEPQGALLGRGVGGSWGRAAARPPFMSPSRAGLPLGRLCLFLSARSAGLSLPWVFWGGRKGPGGGRVVLAGNPAPPRDLPLGPCQAGLQGGRASSWFPPLPAWSQTGRKAPLPACDPDPRPGQRSQPSRPCLFQPAGVLPRPRPHQMLSFAPPHPHSWHSRVVLSHAVPVLRARGPGTPMPLRATDQARGPLGRAHSGARAGSWGAGKHRGQTFCWGEGQSWGLGPAEHLHTLASIRGPVC